MFETITEWTITGWVTSLVLNFSIRVFQLESAFVMRGCPIPKHSMGPGDCILGTNLPQKKLSIENHPERVC